MSTATPPQDQPTPAPQAPIGTIRAGIEAGVKTGNTALKDEVVTHFVNEELGRRRNLLIQGVKKFRELEGDAKKADNPDDVKYNADGSKAASLFTSAALKKLKEAKEKLGNFRKAFDTSINEGTKESFEKLEKFLKGGDQKTDTPATEE